MSKSTPITLLTLTREQHEEMNDSHSTLPPWYIVDCLDQHVFISTRTRVKAQEWVDNEYGKGHYKVRPTKL